METPREYVESLYDSAENYGKTSYELTRLKSLETLNEVAASTLAMLGITVMLIMFTIVLNIGLAILIGDALGKVYYGFFIMSAFYLLVALIFNFFLAGWIRRPISNIIITQAMR